MSGLTNGHGVNSSCRYCSKCCDFDTICGKNDTAGEDSYERIWLFTWELK